VLILTLVFLKIQTFEAPLEQTRMVVPVVLYHKISKPWPDARVLEMAQHGIGFGSHTMNHRLLNKLSEPEVKSEVEEAKREIENLLQKPA
jgi:hypothetical protein